MFVQKTRAFYVDEIDTCTFSRIKRTQTLIATGFSDKKFEVWIFQHFQEVLWCSNCIASSWSSGIVRTLFKEESLNDSKKLWTILCKITFVSLISQFSKLCGQETWITEIPYSNNCVLHRLSLHLLRLVVYSKCFVKFFAKSDPTSQ